MPLECNIQEKTAQKYVWRLDWESTTVQGSSNLLSILAASENADAEVVARRYENQGHGVLKKDVIEALEGLLKVPRAEFERLRKDKPYLDAVAKEGAEKALERSRRTMKEVRTMIGLH